MEFEVLKMYKSEGVFISPDNGEQIAYDNTYVALAAFDDKGNFKKGLFPKFKTKNLPHDLAEGDFVKIYYNEYKVPEALIISRKEIKQ